LGGHEAFILERLHSDKDIAPHEIDERLEAERTANLCGHGVIFSLQGVNHT
jgi:hypothetical protein